MTISEMFSPEQWHGEEPEVNDGLCDLACLIMLVTSDERYLLLSEDLAVGRLKIKKRFELRNRHRQIERLESMLYGANEDQLGEALDLVFAKTDKAAQRRSSILLARQILSSTSRDVDLSLQSQGQVHSGSCETGSLPALILPDHESSPIEP